MPTNDEPTILTREDIDKVIDNLMNSEIRKRCCWKCSKDFLVNHSFELCDQCYFDQFPKGQVTSFFNKIIEDILG